MTPEEKAKELIEKFRKHSAIFLDDKPVSRTANAKACAAICVKEIIAAFEVTGQVNEEVIFKTEFDRWNKVLTIITHE